MKTKSTKQLLLILAVSTAGLICLTALSSCAIKLGADGSKEVIVDGAGLAKVIAEK